MKRHGHLPDREREWIDSKLGAEDEDPEDRRTFSPKEESDLRYRIKKGPGSAEEIQKFVRKAEEDLRRMKWFYCEIEPQPRGRYVWEDEILPRCRDGLRTLGRTSHDLADVAEREIGKKVRAELYEALAPLSSDLTRFREFDNGDIDIADLQAVVKEEEETHGQLLNEMKELQQRREALSFILGDQEWYDVLAYIGDTPGNHQVSDNDLTENMIGGRTWKTAAGQTLMGQYGLIEHDEWGYRLTDRGKAVLEAYSSLEENEFVDGFANETHNAQAALYLLANHFPSEEWEIPDELRGLPS